MGKRIEVGVLGATGMVGQQFIQQLAGHPWFELTWLAASERSQGKSYADAAPWRLETPIPDGIAGRSVDSCTPGRGPRLVFSALDANVAGDLEQAFADAGHVVLSNARNHRMDPMVPLLVPEVNADHLALLRAQAKRSGGKGAIVTNPNCSTVVLSMALAPLRAFGLRACLVSTMQAVSGAGLSRRALARHPRQRDPVHLGRGREDGDRDAQDPRHAEGHGGRAAPGARERAHQPRAGGRRPHRDGLGGSRREALARGAARGDRRLRRRAAAARPAVGAGAAARSTSISRTGRSRASTRRAGAA